MLHTILDYVGIYALIALGLVVVLQMILRKVGVK